MGGAAEATWVPALTPYPTLQIAGLNGLAAGSVTEKLFRDAPILTTYEGTSQIQRLIISREILSQWGRGVGTTSTRPT